MKKVVYLLACSLSLSVMTSVAANTDVWDDCILTVTDEAPSIEAAPLLPTETLTMLINLDGILPEIFGFAPRPVSQVDYYLLKLPKHYLLPTKDIWLLDRSIRLC